MTVNCQVTILHTHCACWCFLLSWHPLAVGGDDVTHIHTHTHPHYALAAPTSGGERSQGGGGVGKETRRERRVCIEHCGVRVCLSRSKKPSHDPSLFLDARDCIRGSDDVLCGLPVSVWGSPSASLRTIPIPVPSPGVRWCVCRVPLCSAWLAS